MNSRLEKEYDFTLVLNGFTPETEGIEDKLYEAGCDDATLAFRRGRPVLTFSRRASTLLDAFRSAMRDIEKAGIGASVVRVDACNLVTLAEIGRRIGRSRQVVHQYVKGERGPGGFPGPECELGAGHWLWRWCEVAYWLYDNDMIKEDVLEESYQIEIINTALSMAFLSKHNAQAVDIYRSLGLGCGQSSE